MNTESITSKIVESRTAPAPEPEMESTDIKPEEMGSRLAILGKKEKGILEKERALQAKWKEIEEKEAKYSKYSQFDDVNEENAFEFLKGKNIPLEKVQEKWLSSLGDDDLDPIQKKIKELESKLASKDSEMKKILDETLSERDSKVQQQEIEKQSSLINENLKKFVSDKAEDFDLIKTFGAEEEVFNVIKQVYMKTAESGEPKLLSFEEACQEYENSLVEKVKVLLGSKKVQSILGGNPDDKIAQLLGQKTIDDSFSQSSASSPDYKTQAERDEAAKKLFEGMVRSGS